uniref:Uncharacterized protein n=1 Tax=Biomphalaria glabrata TaxID=6526 RepID=A0A2C9L525_BIOGL
MASLGKDCKPVTKPPTKKSKESKLNRTMNYNNIRPWISSPYIPLDKIVRPRAVSKVTSVGIPQPDFIAVPYIEDVCVTNGTSLILDEGLLCNENYKTASWATENKHELQVLHRHQWGVGRSSSTKTLVPNNYRIVSGPDFDYIKSVSPQEDKLSTPFNNKIVMEQETPSNVVEASQFLHEIRHHLSHKWNISNIVA